MRFSAISSAFLSVVLALVTLAAHATALPVAGPNALANAEPAAQLLPPVIPARFTITALYYVATGKSRVSVLRDRPLSFVCSGERAHNIFRDDNFIGCNSGYSFKLGRAFSTYDFRGSNLNLRNAKFDSVVKTNNGPGGTTRWEMKASVYDFA